MMIDSVKFFVARVSRKFAPAGCSEASVFFTSPHAASTTTVSNKATAAPTRRNLLIVHPLQPAPSHRPARPAGQPD